MLWKDRRSKQARRGRNWSKDYREIVLTGWLSMTWSACFFIQRRTTCPRVTLSHGGSFFHWDDLFLCVSSPCKFDQKKPTRIYKNLSTVCDNLFKIFFSMYFRIQSMVLLTTCLWFIPHVYLYSSTYWLLPLILPSHLPFQVFDNHILLILYHQLSKIMHIKII